MNLESILMSDDVSKEILNNLDYLVSLIPEIKPMIGFDQKHPHHDLDVFMHTLKALSVSKKDLIVRVTLLFHDIGKPVCFIEGEVRHFPNHAEVGSEITRTVLSRLGYDDELINTVSYLVKYHDTPITKEDILSNYNLMTLRFEVQRCDVYAHKHSMNKKRDSYLSKTKKLLNI